MDVKSYLSEYSEFDVGNNVDIDDSDVFEQLNEPIKKWWCSEFGKYVEQNNGFFTPPQKEAIPKINKDQNTLVASPTGSGKTLTSMITQINRLFERAINNTLENEVYCLYISPLKSLANDIQKNLEDPLNGISEYIDEDIQEIRHKIRHGDTPQDERQKMLKETPHILNTTPETLAILLNSPKFRNKLKSVETVIVDEIHSLASNKRGVHLSLSLERLERLSESDITRIGCSATVEPLDDIGNFLVGYDQSNDKPRDCEIVDTRFVRNTDIKVESPVDDLINTKQEIVSQNFYNRLNSEIQNHSTTIIFTNTRSGAESTLNNLRRDNPKKYDKENSAVHHGSLGKDERKRVEDKLRNGDLDVVTTSTSLELGIDMNDVDLVIQVGSPKSIASLLQRIGRAGHQLGETVEGKVFVLDRNELVECSVMAKKAEEGYIDRIFIPENCQDVATQHVYGIAINNVTPEKEIFDILTSAYPYRNYTKNMYEQLLKYMTADYDGLEDKNVYPKIWRDTNDEVTGEYHYEEYDVGEKLIGKRGKQARVIYYTNIGTIPDSFSCTVKVRSDDSWIGELDEEYLNTLEKGDVFQLGGDNYEYRYRRGSKVYVDRTTEAPTVPSWFSERLPLSYDLGIEILRFQEKIIKKIKQNNERQWLDSYPIDKKTKNAIIQLYKNQIQYKSEDGLSTQDRFIVEYHKKDNETQLYFQSCYGRQFNDGISRLIAQKISEMKNINVQIAVSDHGFALKLPFDTEIDITTVLEQTEESDVKDILRESLEDTDFIKRYFRINSTRSLMILRNYKGNHKSAKSQQVQSDMLLNFSESLDEFAVIEETYREIMEDKLNVNKIEKFIGNYHNGDITVKQISVDSPTPRSFQTAILSSSDVISAQNESKALKEFQEKVLNKIEN